VSERAPEQDAESPRPDARTLVAYERAALDDRLAPEEPAAPTPPLAAPAVPGHRAHRAQRTHRTTRTHRTQQARVPAADDVATSPALAHHTAQQVVAGAVVMTAAVVAFDVALTARLSMFFDLCFVLVGLWAALVVRRNGLYAAGVLPPLLLGAVVAFLAVTMPSTLTASHLAFVSTWLTGLAQHGVALGATHVVVLVIVGLRAGEAHGGRAH
jgi:hypothetical protein